MDFTRYNAFSAEWGHGNPAAIVTLKEDQAYTDEALKTIAQDMLCEVGFILNPQSCKSSGIVRMRYFTAAKKELKFIGHVTIAALSFLADGSDFSITVRSQGGDIPGKIKGKTASIEIAAPTSMYEQPVQLELLEAALGSIRLDRRIPSPIYTYGSSSRLIVFVTNFDDIKPNNERIIDLSNVTRVSGVFVIELSADGSTTRSRMFCPLIGVEEDACSGNAHGLLGFVLQRYGLLTPGNRFTGLQGMSMGRPSTVSVTFKPETNTAEIGGVAVAFCSGCIRSSSVTDVAPPVVISTAEAKQISAHSSDNYIMGMF